MHIIKKIFILIVMSSLLTPALSAQQLSFSWAKSIGGSGWDKAAGQVLKNNTLYLGGNFNDTVQTGNSTLAACDSRRDIFFSASDQEGNPLWEKQIKGSGYDNLNALTVKNNRIFLAGEFSDSIFFEDNTFVCPSYINNYLACYKTDGTYKWSTHIRAESKGKPIILKEFDKGKLFYGLTVFGNYSINEDSLQTHGKSDIVILKFNPAGKITDYFVPEIDGEEELIGFEQTKNGFVIAGNFSRSISIGDTTLNAMGDKDIFFAKFENDDLLWIHHIRGYYNEKAAGLVKDREGNYILGGQFEQAVLTGQNDTFIAPGKQAVFFIQYNENGEEMFARSLGSSYKSSLQDLYISNTNELMLTGSFFGTINYNETDSISSDTASIDMFIAKYDTSRNIKYIDRLSSSREVHNGKLIQDSANYFYISGSFSEDLFAGRQAEDTLLTNKNNRDLFYGRFFDCDYAQKLNLPADTAYCGFAEYTAPEAFSAYLWDTGQTEASIQTDSSRLFTLEVTDEHGCKSSDSIFINVFPQPTVDLGPDTSITTEQSIQIDAGKHDFYLWSTGHTGRYLELEADMLPFGMQTFSVLVQDDGLCRAQDDINILTGTPPAEESQNTTQSTDANTAFADVNKQIQTETDKHKEQLPENDLTKPGMNVYPNPNNGNFYIQLNNITREQNITITITDMLGKTVYRQIFDTNLNRLSIEAKGLNSGEYIITMKHKFHNLTKTIIVE